MSKSLPFTKIIHNPVKSELVLANGQHFLVLNSSTGNIVKAYPQEEQANNVTDFYRSMAFNKDGSLLATSGENKEICVWNTNDWTLKNKRPAYKRINALKFNNNSTEVIAADKFGDVYCHPIKEVVEGEEKLAPIVGHVSMVTDMLLTPDEKYVITSDRDEHIRVSRYPNGYNIESFCLGHTDVVTCISILPWDEKKLVSSGGDCTIRLWDYVHGKQLAVLDLKNQIEAYKPPASDANSEDAIVSTLTFDSNTKSLAVAFAKSPAVIILSWQDSEFVYQETVVVSASILDIEFDLEGKLWIALDDEQKRMAVAVQKDNHYVVDTNADIVNQINTIEVCKTNKMPDLYTIFGLRKFLDLPEGEDEGDKNKKKRKTE
ncbi:WD40-repeat-containing domain protein [Cokeromyces recurvatus]|uniref:WD40-repeat-containing domain protein n=1 Tax=Cokeromyces recurvatus TaxID=90255 RepID=UPI0022209585|nr:WD40-repeat-containing domain protein [Cokeromyces recurvatus]KAI7905621.1 WD40-repeat-containing domain protein [Cokeromyces recurvatus]